MITALLGWREGRDSNPGRSFKPLNRLAGGPIRPLWHLPAEAMCRAQPMAEREGFEPPELALCCFQDSRLQPLGHLSRRAPTTASTFAYIRLLNSTESTP